MSGTYGVEQIKKVLLAIAEVGNVVEKIINKQGVIAIFNLADEFALLATLDMDRFLKEVGELDVEDKLELLRTFEVKFDLANEQSEKFVEGLLDIAIDLSEVVGKVIGLFGKR